jgi:hypothetical protein
MQQAPKVFFSYSHKDEAFKNDLLVQLRGLERQGIISNWHDRMIAVGSNWREAIEDALNSCSVAILLISPDFIASEFINSYELTVLLERRKREILVVPIILRPCLWKLEPALKDLQALPVDGKPVISFPKETGERDEIWMNIGSQLAERILDLKNKE